MSINTMKFALDLSILYLAPLCLFFGSNCIASEMMNGPRVKHELSPERQIETSAVKLVLKGGLKLFQKRVSPVDGPRCGFHPTCSSFGLTAVNQNGAVVGGIMTADRLIRCNPWKKVGDIYKSLPNGKLLDPVEDHVSSK